VSATRVNHTFRSLIRTSPTLQRKTFMRSPKISTPTHCQLVQWGPGLQQRHLAPLPQPSVTNNTAIHALAMPRHQSFQAMTILYRHAVPISQLCPFLEPAESGSMITWNVDLDTSLAGFYTPVRTAARFSENLMLLPLPWTNMPANANVGSTPSSIFASMTATPSPRGCPWMHMQLSTPPTHHAHAKIYWQGRLNGELRVTIEATRCMKRPVDQGGITLHSLVYHVSTSPGPVTISEVPTANCPLFYIAHIEALWSRRVVENSTLATCMDGMQRKEPWRRYAWSVGPRSEVTLHGVVVPTEGELELLAETDQLSSTPAPLVFHLMQPGAAEEEGEEQQGNDNDDADNDADDDADDEEDSSESESDFMVG
jgi:hypothetical protein